MYILNRIRDCTERGHPLVEAMLADSFRYVNMRSYHLLGETGVAKGRLRCR